MTTPAGTPLPTWTEIRNCGIFFRLDHFARLELTGNDRVRYLNGQCSNDVRNLTPGGPAISACILSARGKLDAVVWIWAESERLIVECDASLAEALAMRLEKYIVADDVILTPLPISRPEWHVIPGTQGAPVSSTSHNLRAIPRFGQPGFDVAAEEISPQWTDAGFVEADADMLKLLRVENRVPAWGAELTPDTLPAEAGLDRTAVDFHKGCYLGQEVVSRIESVGRANRTLRAFELVDGPAPQPGDQFPHPEQPNKPGAEITTVAEYFGLSKIQGLCYTRRGVDAGAILRSASGTTRITILD